MEALARAVEELVRNRELADDAARDAIREIENALVVALQGETMRGLPDLGGKVFGVRVDPQASAFAPLPQRRTVLVLEAKGQLCAVSRHGSEAFVARAPRSMVVASVLVPFIRAVGHAISLHLSAIGRRNAEFTKIADIARRICAEVG